MGRLGGHLFIFYPIINHRGNWGENATSYKLGLAHFTGYAHIKKSDHMKVTALVTTLLEVLGCLDGEKAENTFLEVEDSELQAQTELITWGILKLVHLIDVEFHSGPTYVSADTANISFQ